MKLVQVAQYAKDLDRATAFYRELLGVEPTARFVPPGLVFFDLDGVRLLLDDKAPSALLYLAVPDVRISVEQFRNRFRIVSEPAVIFHHDDGTLGPVGTDEWQGFIEDSEGNTVGLVSQLPD